MPDWLWQNSEVSSCLTLVYHQTLSPSSVTHTHTQAGASSSTHMHALCFSVILSPPCHEHRGKTLFSFREQINSCVGDRLWELAGSVWQCWCSSPQSILWKFDFGSWTLMLHLVNIPVKQIWWLSNNMMKEQSLGIPCFMCRLLTSSDNKLVQRIVGIWLDS